LATPRATRRHRHHTTGHSSIVERLQRTTKFPDMSQNGNPTVRSPSRQDRPLSEDHRGGRRLCSDVVRLCRLPGGSDRDLRRRDDGIARGVQNGHETVARGIEGGLQDPGQTARRFVGSHREGVGSEPAGPAARVGFCRPRGRSPRSGRPGARRVRVLPQQSVQPGEQACSRPDTPDTRARARGAWSRGRRPPSPSPPPTPARARGAWSGCPTAPLFGIVWPGRWMHPRGRGGFSRSPCRGMDSLRGGLDHRHDTGLDGTG